MTETQPDTLDMERQGTARRYAHIQRRFWLVQLLLGGAYLGLWSIYGLATLSDWLTQPFSRSTLISWPLDVILAAVLVGGPYWLLTLPLDFHTGYRLPHRFGLSNQSLRGWIVDQFKYLILGSALGFPLLIGLYALVRTYDRWWLLASLAYSLVTVVLATLAPVIFLPLFFKPKPLRQERPDLVDRLTRLACRADAKIEGVYALDMSRRTLAANASLTGLFGTRRILLGDTLLEHFNDEEIEAVLAHELAHHVHKDIPRGIVIQTAFNLASFWVVAELLTRLSTPLGLTGPGDPAGLPLLSLAIGLTSLVTMPLANAYSRWRESLADDFALEYIDRPQVFADAMTRLANQNLADVDPAPWVVFLLHSHPPLRDRIKKAAVYSNRK